MGWVNTTVPTVEFGQIAALGPVSHHVVEVADDAAGLNVVHTTTTTQSQWVVPTLIDREFYYWRHQAVLENGLSSDFSVRSSSYIIIFIMAGSISGLEASSISASNTMRSLLE